MNIVFYFGLFCSAFLAATIFPAQSELSLAAFVLTNPEDICLPLIVATAGNSLGSAVNWILGRWCNKFQNSPWFPKASLDKGKTWYDRFGRWSLFLSWAPVIGDPLTLLAGVMRVPFQTFFLLVFIAKFTRYLVVIAISMFFV